MIFVRKYALLIIFVSALLTVLHASSVPFPSGQNIFDCTTLFTNNVNGNSLVSPALASYSSYTSLLKISLLVAFAMIMLMGLVYVLGIASKWDMLKKFAANEYLEDFLSIIIILIVIGGIAIFNSASVTVANTFTVNPSSSTTSILTPASLYTSLCSNMFSNMIEPGLLTEIWIEINRILIGLIGGLKIDLAPSNFGIIFVPLAGFSLVNQLLWIEGGASFFMLSAGAMMIVLLFVIYYLFPLFLYLGIALRAFPWTRAAGGAFIALFVAFYIFFPAIMYQFSTSFSTFTNPSSSAVGLCSSGKTNCVSSPESLATSSFKAYLGVLNLDVGYTAYTNIYYFSYIFLYLALNVFGLILALLISYEVLGIVGRLLGASSVKGSNMFKKILSPNKP